MDGWLENECEYKEEHILYIFERGKYEVILCSTG